MKQAEGYKAFHPAPLPPDPPLQFDFELLRRLSEADQSLARLDGVTATLPNPDLFVAMYVRQEAVLSSQIEGTQSTLDDLLKFEIGQDRGGEPKDIGEVVNYVRAMNYGLQRLTEFPVSLRLIREIHGELLHGVRGGMLSPGEFRRSQNWIGPAGCTLATATFVPPPVPALAEALAGFETFLHEEELPVLLQCGLAHAQFETIHPFLDGNGRVGRLLITFLLCWRGVLRRPLLYLSLFLKRHRGEYYDRLTATRERGDWEGWLKFFLRGVAEVSRSATETALRILALREDHQRLLRGRSSANNDQSLALLERLYGQPTLSSRIAQTWLGCSAATANKLLRRFADAGILSETTGRQRYRLFRYQAYLDLFAEPAPPSPPAGDDDPDGPALP